MSAPANPSAFPVNATALPNPGAFEPEPGMSLRDWFAGKALQGLLADPEMDMHVKQFAELSYEYADAMLAARMEGRP